MGSEGISINVSFIELSYGIVVSKIFRKTSVKVGNYTGLWCANFSGLTSQIWSCFKR